MPTTLPRLPSHSCALIVEDEPVQGFALECALEELGCRPVGPASTVEQVEKLIAHERPNFALLEGHMLAKSLQALADCLEQHEVPFAVLDIGDETGGLLPGRPRLRRPFHLPDLSAMSTVLLRTDYQSKIAADDWRIAEGTAAAGQPGAPGRTAGAARQRHGDGDGDDARALKLM